MYKIIGVYNGQREEVDTADTRKQAEYLAGEYRLAFGKDWIITIKGKEN